MDEAKALDYYTCEELITLYQETESVDAGVLNQAAKAKYPERTEAKPIQVETGPHGRWFPLDKERKEFAQPEYTIKGGRCCWVGVMEDGTAHAY